MHEMELLITLVILLPVGLTIGTIVLFVRSSRLRQRVEELETDLGRLKAALADRSAAPESIARTRQTPPTSEARVAFEAAQSARPEPIRQPPPKPEVPAEPPPAELSIELPEELLSGSHVKAAETSDDLLTRAGRWLLGGNTLARVGGLLIFFGVGFLLKYASETGWLPIEFRLAGVALGGIALTALGWRLRAKRRAYGLILQGAGVGVIYLTVYAAFALYHLVPAGPGLGILVVLVLLSSSLAVLQDARWLAVMAIAGGFLAPVLMSRGGGSHVMLFSYYALLNAGILGIAWYKAWRELNLLGFLFTFGIGASWGWYSYRPDQLATTEPFLILFFLFYVAVPILFARRQPPRLKGYVDGTLVFGVPLAASVLQSGLVYEFEFGLAISALALGLFYALLARILWQRQAEGLRLLTEAFAALAVVFGTLAIPLAVDGQLTGAVWALEGAAIVWIGVRQQRLSARLFGVLVQFGAGAALATSWAPAPELPIMNSHYLATLMIAVGGLFSAYFLGVKGRDLRPWEAKAPALLLVWGLGWWLLGGGEEIGNWLFDVDFLQTLLAFFALTASCLLLLRLRLDWGLLAHPPLLLLPAMAVVAMILFVDFNATSPMAGWGLPAWGLALTVQYLLLRRLEPDWEKSRFLNSQHLSSLWLLVFLLGWSASHLLEQSVAGASIWEEIAWPLILTAVLTGLPLLAPRIPWPLQRFPQLYQDRGQVPLAFVLGLWILLAAGTPGDPHPLDYLPILNPLELVQLLGLAVLVQRGRQVWAPRHPKRVWYGVAILGFVTLNGMIGRATHFFSGVPFDFEQLWDVAQFQTALSVTWTLAALALTWTATRLGQRPAWFAGAGLLGLVVLKLFLVDLAEVGTVARIVSFLVVGGLVLLIGYFSPLPPGSKEVEE